MLQASRSLLTAPHLLLRLLLLLLVLEPLPGRPGVDLVRVNDDVPRPAGLDIRYPVNPCHLLGSEDVLYVGGEALRNDGEVFMALERLVFGFYSQRFVAFAPRAPQRTLTLSFLSKWEMTCGGTVRDLITAF